MTLVVQRPAMQVLGGGALPRPRGHRAMSIVAYAAQMVWPVGLTAIYPYPRAGIPLWQPMGALILVVAASVVAFRSWARRPWLAVGWSFYLATLVPVLGLVQVGYEARADRYTYVPLLGLFVIVAWGVPELAHASAPIATLRRAAAPLHAGGRPARAPPDAGRAARSCSRSS